MMRLGHNRANIPYLFAILFERSGWDCVYIPELNVVSRSLVESGNQSSVA